jgi:nucleoside-diphosphate-sugar epimerase
VYGFAFKQSGGIEGITNILTGDLLDSQRLASVIGEVMPEYVVHLAAIAFVAHGDVEAIYRTNVIGTRNLLDTLKASRAPLKCVLLASSANIYGNAAEGALPESTPPAPANDYAVSKLTMEYVAALYRQALPITIVRPFNYTGVGQSELFLLPKIIGNVRRREPVIELGNLDVARDFSDVRDVVEVYARLINNAAAIGQTFNVCSGQAHSLQDVLKMAREISGHAFDVRVNPAFVRANEVKILIGDRAKLDSIIGPVVRKSLGETLHWMLAA